MNFATTITNNDAPEQYRWAEKPMLAKRELWELSQLQPWRSTLHILAEWTAVITIATLCQHHWHPLVYALAVMVLASRQHAIMILLHEGTHYRLFRNRKLNDWVSELFLAWPVLISARAYRANHIAHHRYLNTDGDPDWVRRKGDDAWVFPKRPWQLGKLMLGDLVGLGAIALLRLMKTVASRDTAVPRGFLIARYSYYTAILSLAVWFHLLGALLLYWFVPLFTCLIFIFRIRSIAEHSALPPEIPMAARTRTTIPTPLERFLLAPKNVAYHLEHHLYPSVPFYRLPELHALLSWKSEFRDAHITKSYLGVLRECIGARNLRSGGKTGPFWTRLGMLSGTPATAK